MRLGAISREQSKAASKQEVLAGKQELMQKFGLEMTREKTDLVGQFILKCPSADGGMGSGLGGESGGY